MKQFFIIMILVICVAGCGNKSRTFSGIMSKEKMQVVMWDIILADVYGDQIIKRIH